VAKNNQKKEKALRNRENAKKYRKKPAFGAKRSFGNKPPAVAAVASGMVRRPAMSEDTPSVEA
jgi:hypothetical protein